MPHDPRYPAEIAFARSGLSVAYRASAEPQLVDIHLEIAAPDPVTRTPFHVRILIDEINGGAAGGAEFAPTAGRARPVNGPLRIEDPGANGPFYHYTLEVAGVSPRYLRNMVERLSSSVDARALSISGSLPLDQTPLSVRTPDVLSWLGPPRVHLGAFAPPFTVRSHHVSGTDGFVRAVLEDAATNDMLLAFDEAMLVFTGYLFTCGGPGGMGRSRVVLPPAAGRGGRALAARWDDFVCEQPAARDMIVNIMGAFHGRVAPLARLDIGLPS